MCLDSTNKLEHWYVRHNNVYCLHLWATCFNLYTGHLHALLYTRVHKKLCTVGSHRVNKFMFVNYGKNYDYRTYFKIVQNPIR